MGFSGGNGEWWRGIPASELGPIRGWDGLPILAQETPVRQGTQAMISEGHPAPPIYRRTRPKLALPTIEAAANSGDRLRSGAVDPTTATRDPVTGASLSPGAVAGIRAGLGLARGLGLLGPVGIVAGLLSTVLGLAANQQAATPDPTVPDVVPAGQPQDFPVGYDPEMLQANPPSALDVAQPSPTVDAPTVDATPGPDQVAGPTDLNTGAPADAATSATDSADPGTADPGAAGADAGSTDAGGSAGDASSGGDGSGGDGSSGDGGGDGGP